MGSYNKREDLTWFHSVPLCCYRCSSSDSLYYTQRSMAAPSYWNQAAGGNSVQIWIFYKIILISLITSNKKNPQENGICLKQASLSLVQKEDYRGSVCTRFFLFCFITIAYLVIPAFNTVSATHTIHRGTVITAPTALHKRKRETNQTAGVNFRITNILS